MGGLAVLSPQYHTAFHLDAIQTVDVHENETQMGFYTRQLRQHKTVLLDISKHLVDAYFSKKTFVEPMTDNGFHVISRLRNDASLKYLYTNTAKKGRGRPKVYDGKIDVDNLVNLQALCVSHQPNI